MNLANSLGVHTPKLVFFRHPPMQTENVGHRSDGSVATRVVDQEGIWRPMDRDVRTTPTYGNIETIPPPYCYPVHGPPDFIFIHYSGRGNGIDRVTYIFCLRGRVPERYKLWSLNAQGVCEVHPFARIRLLDNFREDTFQTTFFNSRRCRIPFIGRRSLNGSVEFIDFADVTS